MMNNDINVTSVISLVTLKVNWHHTKIDTERPRLTNAWWQTVDAGSNENGS